MPSASQPALAMIALIVLGLGLVAFLIASVKLRAFSARRFGVRVYDFGADLNFPATVHSRGYRFALYLTMKSIPREAREP